MIEVLFSAAAEALLAQSKTGRVGYASKLPLPKRLWTLPRLAASLTCLPACPPAHSPPCSKGSWEGVTPAEASALKREAGATERIVTQDEVFMSYLQEVGGHFMGARR